MKISLHADHTEKLFGIRAEDIHKWIDGFFDHESFKSFLAAGFSEGYDPYDHRSFRHCREALEDAYEEFEGKYTREEIRNIFETHLKDDYDGYVPYRKDFLEGSFQEKFHESYVYSRDEKILTEKELSDYFYGETHSIGKINNSFFKGFNFKIVLPVVLTFLIFVTTVFTLIIPVYKDTVIGRKKEMIRELLSLAVNIIEQYQEKVENGSLELDSAQILAAEEISRLSYGVEGKDYFWITDMHPIMIMHPYRKDLIGKDLSNYNDSKTRSGKLIFVELVNIVKENGEGFIKYDWQWMDDSTRIDPKISYVKGIPKWDWTVGTGVYLTDVEEEIHELADNITYIFILISILILGILFFVVLQSRKIENRRFLAEKGLRDAKDRYRALVEASNEGHILVMKEENVYSNITLQRMTGYSSEELSQSEIWEKLFPPCRINEDIRLHIDLIKKESATTGEFEALLRTRGGQSLEVIVSSSHIFLSEMNGYVVSFRAIVSRKGGVLHYKNKKPLSFEEIAQEIEGSLNTGHIIRMLNLFSYSVRRNAVKEEGLHLTRHMISRAYEIATKRLIDLSIERFDFPPVDFSFLSLGSIARGEMTLFSDQDNAIIFDDVSDQDETVIKRYFLNLARNVCSELDRAGYSFCPGGIMAMNPKWCLTKSQWSQCFRNWIINNTAQGLLDINVFFDIKTLYGSCDYSEELIKDVLTTSKKNPQFLMHLSRNALNFKRPSGQSINIKNALIPIVNFARIYSIKHGITSVPTAERLKQLNKLGVLTNESYENILNVFEKMWHFRFYNQLFAHADLRSVNDDLDITQLSNEDQQLIKKLLSTLSICQSRLSFDFFGMDMS